METLHILNVPGDGIGIENVREGRKVIDTVSKILGIKVEYTEADIGGVAFDKMTAGMAPEQKKSIDSWADEEKVKLTFPQATIDAMDRVRDKNGVIHFGSVGRGDLPSRSAELALLAMRKRYELINFRPLEILPIIAHMSSLSRGPVHVQGFEVMSPEGSLLNGDTGVYGTEENPGVWTKKRLTEADIERTVDEAFMKAKETGKSIMCASKPNVLVSELLLSRVFDEYAEKYAGQVKLNPNTGKKKGTNEPTGQLIIDNAGAQIASNPKAFSDTIVVADTVFGMYLKAIVNTVSTQSASQETLQLIKEKGLYKVVVRELCNDAYFGKREITADSATDTSEYQQKTIEDIVDVGHKESEKLGLRTIDSVTFQPIPTYAFWVAKSMGYADRKGYALRSLTTKMGIELILVNPDLAGVIITPNVVGDLLTDLAAAIVAKTLGILGSSEVNKDGFGNYQQIAGSAPDIAGQNKCNPIGHFKSLSMMFNDKGLYKGANLINTAINSVLSVARTQDIWEPGYKKVGTSQFGDLVVENIMATKN